MKSRVLNSYKYLFPDRKPFAMKFNTMSAGVGFCGRGNSFANEREKMFRLDFFERVKGKFS